MNVKCEEEGCGDKHEHKKFYGHWTVYACEDCDQVCVVQSQNAVKGEYEKVKPHLDKLIPWTYENMDEIVEILKPEIIV